MARDVLAKRERAAETLAIHIFRELNRFDAGRVLYLGGARRFQAPA
jgi:hypothetical protein